jgi:hypothetical protein
MTKLTESDQGELRLDSYLMYIHNTHCVRCHSGERYGQLYEVWIHPTKTRLSGFRELRPAHGALRDGLHINYVEIPERLISICSDCVRDYKVPAESTAATNVISAQEWAETLRRKYSPAPAEPKAPRAAAASPNKDIPPPTPDQL